MTNRHTSILRNASLIQWKETARAWKGILFLAFAAKLCYHLKFYRLVVCRNKVAHGRQRKTILFGFSVHLCMKSFRPRNQSCKEVSWKYANRGKLYFNFCNEKRKYPISRAHIHENGRTYERTISNYAIYEKWTFVSLFLLLRLQFSLSNRIPSS